MCHMGNLLSNLCLYSSLPVKVNIVIPGQGWYTTVCSLVYQEKWGEVLVPEELM
jgi:hypothetical protein